jgi:hypothetical protein
MWLRVIPKLHYRPVVASPLIPCDSYLLSNPRAVAAGFGAQQAGAAAAGYFADCYHYPGSIPPDSGMTDAQLTHRAAHALFTAPLLRLEVLAQYWLSLGPKRTAAGTDVGATMCFDVGDRPGGVWTVARKTDTEVALEWEQNGMAGVTVVGVGDDHSAADPEARALYFGSAIWRVKPRPGGKAERAPASPRAMTFHRVYSKLLTGLTYRGFAEDYYTRRVFPNLPRD